MCNCNVKQYTTRLAVGMVMIMTMLFITACGGSGYEDYFPAEDGSISTYRVTMLPSMPGVGNIRYIVRTDGQEKINGNTYWKNVEIMDGVPGEEPTVTLWRVDDKGVWQVENKDPAQSEYLSFPFDAKDGTSWTISTIDSERQHVLAVPVQVIMPDKTYDECIRVSITGTQNGDLIDAVEYYCKNVGMVKANGSISGIQVELILESNP